ncbi:hypothetical protein HPB48_007867 [Haemaphysalis longicornis]|uniref:Uncharacterized protein n=1 Tax=Haemaphysalis longicornis TaxID=44386 RepID=A0A9J6FUG0_HAELO|nr:hypothetical protein HPB48_007867 [Haemaphysalis longicornis]
MRVALVPPLLPLLVLLAAAAAPLLRRNGHRLVGSSNSYAGFFLDQEEEHVSDATTEPEELLIAGFFPTTLNLSEGAIGRGVVPAVNLALRHINSSPHFLPGYRLDIIWNDTQVSRRRRRWCASGTRAVSAAFDRVPVRALCTVVSERRAARMHFSGVCMEGYGSVPVIGYAKELKA